MSAPRRLIASFVLLLLLPAAAVVWLGVRLIAQDRALEASQSEERRKSANDRAVAFLEQALTATERNLPSAPPPQDEDAVLLSIRSNRIEANPPQRLLYYPAWPPKAEPQEEFAAGEELEFRRSDYIGAAAAFRALTASPAEPVRAGALLRLARNLRRLGRSEEALRVYQDLSRLKDVQLDGVPADLAASRAGARLLKDSGRVKEAQEAELALIKDLLAGRWRLDRGTFFDYVGEHPIPPEQEALAEAAAWVEQIRDPAGRRALVFAEVPVVVLWQPVNGARKALIAGPRFQQREWLAGLAAQFDPKEISITLAGSEDRAAPDAAVIRRTAAETGLPWTVLAATASGASGPSEFANRRQMLLTGLGLLIALVIAGGYFTLRAVTRELEVARLQSDFVSSVSHEFRTPLTSLRQFTDLLSENDDLPVEKRRGFYQAQTRATERLQRLVESLLDFGRMEAGKHPYKYQRLEAAPLVRGVVDDFQREIAPQGFTVESSIGEACGAMNVDPEALSRALWNLLDNAVKYSGESRTVWVDLERRNGSVAIRVRDRGLGIPHEEQSGIFQKFVRGREARSNNIKGTGIGLAMVRHIVDGHGGGLELESAPGKGSTFTILIPGEN